MSFNGGPKCSWFGSIGRELGNDLQLRESASGVCCRAGVGGGEGEVWSLWLVGEGRVVPVVGKIKICNAWNW